MTAAGEHLAPAHAAGRRLPDFFIVGHAKCGTTALYEMLRRHPQIRMSELKEPQFFARENPQLDPAAPIGFEHTGRRLETYDEYLARFAGARADQLMGDASTAYLWSHTAAARIAAVAPRARIVAILREPAAFLRSLHLQLLQNGSETESDLRKAIELEPARREGRSVPPEQNWPQALIYSERVRYVEQLRRLHAVFPREQVLTLIYDDFRADNEATMRRVQRFLGIDDSGQIEAVEANPSIRVRSEQLRGAVRAAYRAQDPASRAVRGTLKAIAPVGLRRRVRHRLVYGKPRPADELLMNELRRRFQPEVVALSDYLERDLAALWGYGDVD
jgi:sulfotransferase family protein